MALRWSSAQAIGEALYDRDEDTHPLTLRFTALHALVIALDGFQTHPRPPARVH